MRIKMKTVEVPADRELHVDVELFNWRAVGLMIWHILLGFVLGVATLRFLIAVHLH